MDAHNSYVMLPGMKHRMKFECQNRIFPPPFFSFPPSRFGSVITECRETSNTIIVQGGPDKSLFFFPSPPLLFSFSAFHHPPTEQQSPFAAEKRSKNGFKR